MKLLTYLINTLYCLISLIDYVDYKYVHSELLDGYKTIQDINISELGLEIRTDTGFKPVSNFMLTKPFEQYIITLENGYSISVADKHRLFRPDMSEVYADELKVGDYVQTDCGPQKIDSIIIDDCAISMCDITVADENHRFYANGILSHNSTTTAIYCLWVILFNVDKIGLILSKSGPAGVDLLKKIKDMYMYLPYYLKCGSLKWNQTEISFDNNSSISTEPFSPTAGLGKTINFLILDEFAWCPPNDVELFYNNIIPTVTTISNANVCIMSTQNGFNLFCQLWQGAITGKNIYGPFKVDWQQVPQFNDETKQWEKRDEAWHKKMVGVLGSEEKFQYQYGTAFSASDKCLVSREALTKVRERTTMFVTKHDHPVMQSLISPHKEFMYWHPDFDLYELYRGFFVVLVDLAEGGGGDADATVFKLLKVIDKDHLTEVGCWRTNTVEIEYAAVNFWIMMQQLFPDPERVLYSIEWNTYGALFFNYIINLNDSDNMPETQYRWMLGPEAEIDTSNFVYYKRGSLDENIPGISHKRQEIPGLRWSGESKRLACALAKLEIEKGFIDITDLITGTELENFEDQNGNGHYKASVGHDDNIMTLMQIPMLKQTGRWKNFIEDMQEALLSPTLNNLMSRDFNYSQMNPMMDGFGGMNDEMLRDRIRNNALDNDVPFGINGLN